MYGSRGMCCLLNDCLNIIYLINHVPIKRIELNSDELLTKLVFEHTKGFRAIRWLIGLETNLAIQTKLLKEKLNLVDICCDLQLRRTSACLSGDGNPQIVQTQ